MAVFAANEFWSSAFAADGFKLAAFAVIVANGFWLAAFAATGFDHFKVLGWLHLP